MPYVAEHNPEKCRRCGVCADIVDCPGAEQETCIGCGSCVLACPNAALELRQENREKQILIEVDGVQKCVSERISVKEALEEAGYRFSSCLPTKDEIYAPCHVGACWSCAVEIDGEVRRSCVTQAKDGMKIRTQVPKDWTPVRLVGRGMGHPTAGVGTPWQLKNYSTPIEICTLVAGCNFRCPQCQNWFITYAGKGQPWTPKETAEALTNLKKQLNVNRFTISGGECTLNRVWLTQLLRELRDLNPEPETRLHVSTNGSLLTEDYIDELVDAGLTDLGIDIKALEIDTFARITGLDDRELVQTCKDSAWKAVDYVFHRYHGKVFLGIGIPYNKDLISMDEIGDMGKEICSIAPTIQTIANDYRGEYRSKITRPTWNEMKTVHSVLKGTGLTTVLCQTQTEIIGP